MNLLEKLGDTAGQSEQTRQLFTSFGVTANPFPPAGQPSGHPHLDVAADEEILRRLRSFLDAQQSQVLLISGDQGVGKTNLLAHYDSQLRKVVDSGRYGRYVVHYYSDPEPTFDGVLAHLLQELGETFLIEVGSKIAQAENPEEVYEKVRNRDLQSVIRKLSASKAEGEASLTAMAKLAFEWVTGSRLLNRHRDGLGVFYRLDTLESKTQVLRDLMIVGDGLGIVRGVFLLLDELEKQGYTTSKVAILKYLLAIRALIDALPRFLFLMVALTPVARNRYFQMLPALQSRLQREVPLDTYKSWTVAELLYRFYLNRATERARTELQMESVPGSKPILSEGEAKKIFESLIEGNRRRGVEGVTPRDLLEAWHDDVQQRVSTLTT